MVTKYKGIAVQLGDEELVVPPIALGALEQLQSRLSGFTGDVTDISQIGLVLDVALAALKRNYPEMTRDQLADLIDVGNMMEVFEAVMDVSGLKRKAAQGEAQAAV